MPTRRFAVGEKSFAYLTIKREAFAGYSPVQRRGRTVLMAEPEKALVDYLYFVSLGKKPGNDRLRLTGLDPQKVMRYASVLRNLRKSTRGRLQFGSCFTENCPMRVGTYTLSAGV